MLVLALFFGSAHAAGVTPCSQQQLLAYAPDASEVKMHRSFAAPVISYPYGTKMAGWGWRLAVRVDEAGRVACYATKDQFGDDLPMNAARQAFLDGLAGWRYAPFVRDGSATAAIVVEQVSEQESPGRHLPLPGVPLVEVHVALGRSGCYGSCPRYQVDIRGDGRVAYQGDAYVDVIGRHEYNVPAADVAKLVDSLRAKDIWSLRSSYRARITDNPDYELILTMGGQVHRLDDYVGQSAGMPAAVSEFEDEVDAVAHSAMWTHLSRESLERLKAEGFRFDSRDGADLLARAMANRDSRDDGAMLELVKLGAPLDGSAFDAPWLRQRGGTVLDDALRNHRSQALVDALVAEGALTTDGRPDQNKIDAAFREAIEGGRLALVQRIWAVAGTQAHPSLSFKDVEGKISRQSPVTLLLSRPYDDDSWEGLAIAQWLAAQGCDLKAKATNGRTLLHIAASANDAGFVRYMLDAGVGASTPGEYGLPALGSTQNEDVAMILLQAGTDFSRMDDTNHQFLRYARSNHWARVVAWLKAHHEG
ncbi:ankyrin repeat domain-containing protein [Rhodanobacter sp. DHB23]|uniref:ankyrin repeat domain-containing protein n=1 Tax=Rhodanobacter sp. DHB23 TaxID=2775923 RepID=UPI001780A3A2|nr:ankyrin repeat domain-containing protein [Rhodanobacter sp. DHB23]MBD8874146.1 ankyrin repeat domain-containing protein [Rhodanobacter sp. DHB23]